MTTENAQQVAAQHGFAIETHDCCVLVLVPYSTLNGLRGVDAIPAVDHPSLRVALGY